MNANAVDPVDTARGQEAPGTESAATAATRLHLPHMPRVTLSRFLMPVATALGLWLLVEQLLGLGEIKGVFADVTWAWVLVVLLVTQATSFTEAVAMTGAAPIDLPLWRLTLLRFAMGFTGLIGGTVATTATVVRFNRLRGLEPAVALSSGLLYSVSGFVIQIVLTLAIFPFVVDDFHRTSAGASGSGPEVLQILLYAVAGLGLIGGVIFMVPRVRRLVASRVKPQFASAWGNVRRVARDPRHVVLLFAGGAATQLLMAAGLGLSLRSVGAHVGFGALIIVCTFTALLGGMAPVPGGMGVMEASYISGLTLLGVPQDQAVAATFLYRACTTYLPPIWGYVALVLLRRHRSL
jgi:uncharacterized membrane protein YbhN (UPF0104 family)